MNNYHLGIKYFLQNDSGGLAVGMKLESENNLNRSIMKNLQNALSYLQLQDEAMDSERIVDRVGQLRALASDITKNDSDILNYSKEFLELQGKWITQRKQNLMVSTSCFPTTDIVFKNRI